MKVSADRRNVLAVSLETSTLKVMKGGKGWNGKVFCVFPVIFHSFFKSKLVLGDMFYI